MDLQAYFKQLVLMMVNISYKLVKAIISLLNDCDLFLFINIFFIYYIIKLIINFNK